MVQKGSQSGDSGQIQVFLFLLLKGIFHQLLYIGRREDRGDFFDFLVGKDFLDRFICIFLFINDPFQGFGCVCAQKFFQADVQNATELFQLGDIGHGIAPLPVGDSLITDFHGICQIHLCHILGDSCLPNFSCYKHGIEHNFTSFSVQQLHFECLLCLVLQLLFEVYSFLFSSTF